MTDQDPQADLPADAGPVGKPSQAEGADGSETRPDPAVYGKPSQAEGEDPDNPHI